MKTDFIPKRTGNLDAFEENFINKLEDHAELLGLDPAVVARTKDIIQSHRTSYSSMKSIKQSYYAASEDQQTKRDKAVSEVRRIAKLIKASRQYDESIGDALGIIGPQTQVMDTAEMKPILNAAYNEHAVVIKYLKNGADGIKLYSRLVGEIEFREIAIVTTNSFTDSTAKIDADKPEQREYYAVYIYDYAEIGFKSDVVKVVVH